MQNLNGFGISNPSNNEFMIFKKCPILFQIITNFSRISPKWPYAFREFRAKFENNNLENQNR